MIGRFFGETNDSQITRVCYCLRFGRQMASFVLPSAHLFVKRCHYRLTLSVASYTKQLGDPMWDLVRTRFMTFGEAYAFASISIVPFTQGSVVYAPGVPCCAFSLH